MKKAKFEKLLEKQYKTCVAYMKTQNAYDYKKQQLNAVYELIESYKKDVACYCICVQTLKTFTSDIRDISKSIFVKAVCREIEKLKSI